MTTLPCCCSENQTFRALSMKSWGIPPLLLNRLANVTVFNGVNRSILPFCSATHDSLREASRRLNYTRSASKMFLKCLSPNRPWRFCTATISGTPEIEVLTNWKLHELKDDSEMLTQKSRNSELSTTWSNKNLRFPTPKQVIRWRRQCPANKSILTFVRRWRVIVASNSS